MDARPTPLSGAPQTAAGALGPGAETAWRAGNGLSCWACRDRVLCADPCLAAARKIGIGTGQRTAEANGERAPGSLGRYAAEPGEPGHVCGDEPGMPVHSNRIV